MTHIEQIDSLAEELQWLTEPDRCFDGNIMVALGLEPKEPYRRGLDSHDHMWFAEGQDRLSAPRYTGRVDAAMAIIPDDVCYEIWRHVLTPPMRWTVVYWRRGAASKSVTHPLAAIALSIVALKTHGRKA